MHSETTKFREMALLLAEQSVDAEGRCRGDKLDALMFWADAKAHTTLGASISGATYRHQPHGPWPAEEAQAVKDMSESGMMHTQHVVDTISVVPWFIPQRPADRSLFTDAELAILDQVGNRYGAISPDEAGVLVRQEAPYRAASHLQEVPFPPSTKTTMPPTPSSTIDQMQDSNDTALTHDFSVPAS